MRHESPTPDTVHPPFALADRVDASVQHEVEQFLFYEAELLDQRRLPDWIQLLADDLRYFMPLRRNVAARELATEWSGDKEIGYFDEDKTSMMMRVRKLQTGQAWAEEPPSRTRHLVSNVRISAGEGISSYRVKSAFLCYRNRAERQSDFLVGERHDILRRTGGAAGFELARRTILLDQSTFLANNLSFFL